MKYSTFIPTIILTLTSTAVLANEYTCTTLVATVSPLTPEIGTCTIAEAQANHFPDLSFNSGCFSTTLNNAKLGGKEIKATAYSGLTDTSLQIYGQLKAATMLIVRNAANTLELGRVYTQDNIDLVLGMESLTMVSGTRSYKGGHGNYTLTGNASDPNPLVPVTLKGTICIEN
jgi:hypothetical protein